MGRLGDWDKVEKRNRPVKFTRSDELWEYAKMCVDIFSMHIFILFILGVERYVKKSWDDN